MSSPTPPTSTDPVRPGPGDALERGLRVGARALARRTPPDLRGRILDRVRAEGPPSPAWTPALRGAGYRLAPAIALLAAAVVLGLLLVRPGDAPEPAPAPRPRTVQLADDLLGLVDPLLALPGSVDAQLTSEARNVLLDTSRAAERLVRTLPAPLRERLERL